MSHFYFPIFSRLFAVLVYRELVIVRADHDGNPLPAPEVAPVKVVIYPCYLFFCFF